MVQHVIAVGRSGDWLFMLVTIYEESNGLNPVANIFRQGLGRTADFDYVLNTNQPLGSLWVSPEGHLWCGSSNGNIWTSSPQTLPTTPAGLDFDTPATADGTRLTWSVGSLPPHAVSSATPIVTAVWGTSDRDVHAGTFRGSFYHWDGVRWMEMPSGLNHAVNRFHGLASNDVYAVGYGGLISHFDGLTWQLIACPPEAGVAPTLTGVRAISETMVFICGTGGQVLIGNAVAGFRLLTREDVAFYGLAYFERRIVLAAGNDGVFELDGAVARLLKDNCQTVSVHECGDLLFFVEPSQDPGPRVIEYNPREERPWTRRGYYEE